MSTPLATKSLELYVYYFQNCKTPFPLQFDTKTKEFLLTKCTKILWKFYIHQLISFLSFLTCLFTLTVRRLSNIFDDVPFWVIFIQIIWGISNLFANFIPMGNIIYGQFLPVFYKYKTNK